MLPRRFHRHAAFPALSVLAILLAGGAASAQAPDVPYVPTPEPVVEAMLELAGVGPDDYVIDLGSGDGRIVVSAAKDYGAQGHGIDINPVRIEEARANAAEAGVTDQVRFIQGNLFEADLRQADVLTMYLLPDVNLELRPRILEQLAPGTRVVSHDFNMGEWAPDRQIKVPDDGSDVYLWIVPAQVEGAWQLDTGEGQPWSLDLEQDFQRITGKATRNGETISLTDGRLVGDQVVFDWPDGRRFTGRVGGEGGIMLGRIEGTQQAAGDWQAVREGS